MKYKITSKKELPKSILELEIEIAWETVAGYEAKVIKQMTKHIELPGFRKGHVPEDMVRSKVGDIHIIEDMADMALKDIYPDIVEAEKIFGIGRPSVVITKIARGTPVSVRIDTAVLPMFKLPDYKKIASKVKLDKVEVTEGELDKFIEEIRKNYARANHSYADGHSHDNEHRDEDLVLPELNDEFAAKLGEFKTVEELKEKLKVNLYNDKDLRARNKRRAEIAEAILAETPLEVPDLLVDSELDKMLGQFESDIAAQNIKLDDYLKHLKKSREDLKSDWRNDAVKRASVQLIIAKIADAEKVKPSEDKVKEHYDAILTTYHDADPFRVKMYVEEMLSNEMVFDMLEK